MINDKKLWDYYQTLNRRGLEGGHPRQRILFKFIKALVVEDSRILEIGYGDAYLLKFLCNAGYKCTGADISKKNVELGKKGMQGISFKKIEPDGILPFESNHFNGFIASEVFEHMNTNQLKKTVKEMYRILRSNGYAFITFPANEILKDNQCFCSECGKIFHKFGHKQSWDKKKIKEVFAKFDIIKLKRILIKNEHLNIWGKLEFYLKKFLTQFLGFDAKGLNFLIILKK